MDERCRRIDELLTDAMTRELSPEERSLLDDHCAACPSCAEQYRALTAVRETLRRHRPEDDALSEDMRAALHRRLVEESARPERAGGALPFGPRWKLAGAMFALIMLTLCLFSFLATIPDGADEGTVVSRSVVNAGEPLTIRLTYTADRSLADVRVTVQLDDGVFFHTDDETLRRLKEYVWKGDLKEGRNEIPFVVEVARTGTHRIRTAAAYDGMLHRHEVELQAGPGTVAVIYRSFPERPL